VRSSKIGSPHGESMSEEASIAAVSEPGTREGIAADLRALGIQSGEVLLVHSSLSSLGWINGGPVTVIQALQDVLGPEGTLVMPAHSGEYSDPAEWGNPPVPQAWHETIRRTMPLFDVRRTPTRGMGRIAELFRTWPDVMRSSHPQVSFAACGKQAALVTADHELAYSLGETSPLARVYELDGRVLLLGVGFDRNTSFHLAEYRVPDPPLVKVGAPWLRDGAKVWQVFDDVELDDGVFPEIGQALECEDGVTLGPVRAATCRLFDQRPAVDFAVEWLCSNRNSVG
jgi:aminoglycoside 3-N-acetyltransferase